MRKRGLVPVLWDLLRAYLVPALLVGGVAVSLAEVYLVGTPPAPQGPPEGYVVESGRVDLEWNRGTRDEPIVLQVSVDDPEFTTPILERKVAGTSHTLNTLEPGHTYYWRLVQGSEPGPVASFSVSRNYVNL